MTTPTDPNDRVPPTYQDLVQLWGPALGLEETRTQWSTLVAAAEAGKVTLIARENAGHGPQWAALVPLSEVSERIDQCPVWPLGSCRAKLGVLFDAASAWPYGPPQVIARHRIPCAALIPAVVLAHRHRSGERLNAEKVLQEGGSIILAFAPGEDGQMNEDGDVSVDPEPSGFVATAHDHTGQSIGHGWGETMAESLMTLGRPLPWAPSDHDGWSDEPPF